MRILFLLLFSCFFTNQEFDEVQPKDLTVNDVPLGASLKDFAKKMGKADSIRTGINEFLGFEYKKVFHHESSFAFSADGVDGFNITDESFFISVKNSKIYVGNSPAVLMEMFPVSYRGRYKAGEHVEVVKVRFGDSDEYLLFRIADHKIPSILTWSDW